MTDEAESLMVEAKICGLSTPETVKAAVDGGADYIGFVFYPPSPRCVTPKEQARLAKFVPEAVIKVGLVVDADDATLEKICAAETIDLLQLHGTETPERVAEIRERFAIQVMKVIPIASAADVAAAHAYEPVADLLLFDARAPDGATQPGGNAIAFDWALLLDEEWERPWMLAGGLNAANVIEAVRASGAEAVDVSSGVEDAPGVKSIEKIAEFLGVVTGM